MQIASEYRRIIGRDVWHFHERCRHMKRLMGETDGIYWRALKPKSGEMCNECMGKSRADKRTQTRKRGAK